MAINNREEIMQLGMDEGSDTEEGNPRLQLTHEGRVIRRFLKKKRGKHMQYLIWYIRYKHMHSSFKNEFDIFRTC
jgi:hypothetical protein